MLSITPRRSRSAAAALTILLAAPALLHARHSDIPDLPPVAPSTAAMAIGAMQRELAAFERDTADLLSDSSQHPGIQAAQAPQEIGARAALAAWRLDLIASSAITDLSRRTGGPAEIAPVLAAHASAQARVSGAIALHHRPR